MLTRALMMALFSVSLAACQTTRGGGCPALPSYSLAQLAQAKAERRLLPNEGQINKLLADYSKIRDASRAGAQ